MARTTWKAHCEGGRLVVANGSRVWIGPASPKSPSSFTEIPHGAIPPTAVRCVATDGTRVVVGSGGMWNDDWEEYEGDCTLTILDASSFEVLGTHSVESLGDNAGIAAGHVIDWYWYAQSDLLGVHVGSKIDGSDPQITSDLIEDHFDYCDPFNVCGNVVAGIIDYRETLYIGSIGEEPRAITVPEPFRNPHGFGFIGFDLDSHLVLTVRGLGEHLGGDGHRAWRLELDDSWTDLGEWTVEGGYEVVRNGGAVEFAGKDGRLVRLDASQLPA